MVDLTRGGRSWVAGPYRLVLGGSVPQLGSDAPRDAENCSLVLPLAYGNSAETTAGAPPRLPDAVFPEWSGTYDARASAIARCVADVVRYTGQVNSLDELRTHYSMGEYDGAFINAPLRHLLDEAT